MKKIYFEEYFYFNLEALMSTSLAENVLAQWKGKRNERSNELN